MIGGKMSLIYRKNSYIFNLPVGAILFAFRVEILGRNKDFAVLPTLEEGLLHKNKLVLSYVNLGEGNAFIF
jgi:hypothetical protein